MNSFVKILTRCSVVNICGLPRLQEDVKWRYSHCIGGAGLQIGDVHGCVWSFFDDWCVAGVVDVADSHLITQNFTHRAPRHVSRADSHWCEGNISWWRHHFQEKI